MPCSPCPSSPPPRFPVRLFLLLILLTACSSQPLTVTREPVLLRVVASDACAPVVEELALAYQEERTWVTVEVTVFDAAAAEDELRAGRADLAALSWVSGGPLWSVPFATDGIAVIVHPSVPTDGLDLAELREVFSGRVGEWAGGAPIQIVSREAGAGLRNVFEAAVMDGRDVTLTALVAPDSDGVLAYVASTAGAIGYVSLDRLEPSVRAIPVAGVVPSRDTLNENPLAYPLRLVALAEPLGEVRAFAQWVIGPEGQEIVLRHFGPPP